MKAAPILLHWLLSFFVLVPASAVPLESDDNFVDPIQFTVPYVDLQRYSGNWYEVAMIPTTFERQCAGGTTAEYKIISDGFLAVKNSCFTKDGHQKVSIGRGKVLNKQSNAELKVTFFDLFGHWVYLFGGRYEVIGLADDYRWAVVGNRNLKYGWILSRTPEMSDDDWHETLTLLEQKGYNVCLFVRTPQSRPYADRTSVCE